MSKLLLLYGYNNYFNRIMKRESSLANYKSAVLEGHYVELNSANFNVTDGVNARHIFNVSEFLDNKSPDYLVRQEKDGTLSRWFVLESVKVMGGQVQLSLRRDVLADYYDSIKTAPAFIKKGMLSYDSPLIFNKEGMSFNQIKKKEILLKDKTNCGWVVGYLARGNVLETEQDIYGDTPYEPGEEIDYDDLPNSIKTLLTSHQKFLILGKDKFTMNQVMSLTNVYTDFYGEEIVNVRVNSAGDLDFPTLLSQRSGVTYEQIAEDVKNILDVKDIAEKFFNSKGISLLPLDDYLQYNGKTIIDSQGNRKILNFTKTATVNPKPQVVITKGELLSTTYGLAVNNYVNLMVNTGRYIDTRGGLLDSQSVISTNQFNYEYEATLDNIETARVVTHISNSKTIEGVTYNRNVLIDSPYDMFCIPYKSIINIHGNIDGIDDRTIKVEDVALQLARGFKNKLGTDIYDIQLLPYCPIPGAISESGENIEIDNLIEHKDYEFVRNESTDDVVSIVLFPIRSSGSIDINLDSVNNPELLVASDTLSKKVEAETKVFRFVSPNYSGSFDFNAQKNSGLLVVNVDYNYKPYTPYIHVAPVFSNLYGNDFNDARGLICGGDFSISTATSQWEQYQIQNKNYENIFNRQIQNLDVNNSITMEKEKYTAVIGGISNTISTSIGGAVAGSAAGPWGAVAGAVVGAGVGAATSTVGALKDVELLSRSQSENRQYAVDMYNYNLQNIQALPYTLSKVSTFNENNKIFPFIEIYDCTDLEKQI